MHARAESRCQLKVIVVTSYEKYLRLQENLMRFLSVVQFLADYGGPKRYLKKYGKHLMAYGKAWENRDIEAILNHFHDEFYYSDPISKNGIRTKLEMRNHLEKVFARFPIQKWTGKAMMYPGLNIGKFAIYYEFELQGKSPSFTGSGMERIEFKGDKLIEDIVHLHFAELDYEDSLGFKG